MGSGFEIEVDFGPRKVEARRYVRANPEVPLGQFLESFPARFPTGQEPNAALLLLPVSRFTLRYVVLSPATDAGDTNLSHNPLDVRNELEQLWTAEKPSDNPPPQKGKTAGSFPKDLSDNQAVLIAYGEELDAIADYLKNNLSVLVVCDKILTEFIYEWVCHKAGRRVVLDTNPEQEGAAKQGLTDSMEMALRGGATPNPMAFLPGILHNLKPNEVLVLRSLDLLDSPSLVEVLYQRSNKGQKPQLLAFLDPSLEVRKVLTNRFAVHVSIMGLPRYVSTEGRQEQREHTVARLLTANERARFAHFDPESLYKNVAGLNAIQFRNAMQFVASKVVPHSSATDIYRMIREFKTSSSEEIDIPDTSFKEIGGYEHVKQELQRIIALTAGPIQGMTEKQRGDLIPRGFIFHGPPGTGKTLFAKAIANEMNATIQMISGPEIMDKYVGQSENNIRRIFATARRNAPAVIFFDEFDSIASQRSTYSDGGSRANNAVVAQFLTELDGFRQEQAVLVIGTTNRIDIIDEALLRPSRLRPIEIPLPDYTARRRVAAIHALNFGVDQILKDLCELVSRYADSCLPAHEGEFTPPAGLLEELFARHPPLRIRYQTEEQKAAFLREIEKFQAVLWSARETTEGQESSGLLEDLNDRLLQIGRQYGLNLERDMASAGTDGSPATETVSSPMCADICDLLAIVAQEREKRGQLNSESFLTAVLDLVTEYTGQFNNDEIRAVFQEASLEYHMDGQLITPRYLGQKIGLIRKRRDEREATHLSAQRGRHI